MRTEKFAQLLYRIGIRTVTGIPDSVLQPFCSYMDAVGNEKFVHYVPAHEGAAVGIAIGSYLASKKPACVYAQNSGIGNMVNPLTSLANSAVYGIPMLLLVGWRGEPGTEDEPQHKFMGGITGKMLDDLQIGHYVLKAAMTDGEMMDACARAEAELSKGRQYAFVITKGFFDMEGVCGCQNDCSLSREQAIREIVLSAEEEDVFVSTTGKISRELYELMEQIKGNHKQAFLTVGGMGHASMIAFGIAKEKPDRSVYCLDGDGAALMHMGSLAFLGKQKPENLVHICLDNGVHESVGGMPTGSSGLNYAKVAAACGYPAVHTAHTMSELKLLLADIRHSCVLTFLEVRVSIGARAELGRPRETAVENKHHFMRYLGGEE